MPWLGADHDTKRSVQLGPVRNVFEALSSNTVNELLGVRRCTRWAVTLDEAAPGALDLPPKSCTTWGRDRSNTGGKIYARLDRSDEDMVRDGSTGGDMRNRKLLNDEDCEI